MWKTFVRLTPSIAVPLVRTSNQNETKSSITHGTSTTKTGWERVRDMYSKNEFGERSMELHSVIQVSCFSIFFGGITGGILKSRDARMYFIESNQATPFKSKLDAQKMLQNAVTVGFGKGVFQWGWRIGLLTGTCSLIATTISVYKDDTSLLYFIIASAVTGFLYRFNLGPTAMVVSSALATALSTIGGLIILGLLNITGLSVKEIRAMLYSIHESRKSQLDQATEKGATIKHDNLTRHHDHILETRGIKSLQEIE